MHLLSNIYVKYFGTQLLGGPLPLGLTRGPLYIVYPVYPIVTPLGSTHSQVATPLGRFNPISHNRQERPLSLDLPSVLRIFSDKFLMDGWRNYIMKSSLDPEASEGWKKWGSRFFWGKTEGETPRFLGGKIEGKAWTKGEAPENWGLSLN